jgi:hypothetical protein
VVKSNSYQMYN